MIRLPTEFKEFLRLLRSEKVNYLLVGAYAVGYYGYPRSTGDIDIWVDCTPHNAQRLINVLRQFGFSAKSVSAGMFQETEKVFRIGVPPLCIDILTSVSGVEFQSCFDRRVNAVIDGVDVDLIELEDLKTNKRASGRFKDLNDLENLV